MLTDVQCRKAKVADKPYKLTDSGGLHLYVTPAGGKHWRYRYEVKGRERVLSIGPYPAISIVEARSARDGAKTAQREGRDPSVAKKIQRAKVAGSDSATFESMAREWHGLNKSRWSSIHSSDVIGSLERFVFPVLGALPVTEIEPPAVLDVLRKIENRPAVETARRVRQRISSVFVYAIATGRGVTDPAAIIAGALAPAPVKRRQLAITNLDSAHAMMRKVEAEPANAVSKLAHRFLALTAIRKGTLVNTPWIEFDEIADNVWHIPAARMKLELKRKSDEAHDHFVPLSKQALDVIAVLRKITGGGPLAFPSDRNINKPLYRGAFGGLLEAAGYSGTHVPHGWRSTFSTVMNERFPADHNVIELMLAHAQGNKVSAAYNRAAHLERRKELAQIWADLILKNAKPAASLLEGSKR
jgi:integrase